MLTARAVELYDLWMHGKDEDMEAMATRPRIMTDNEKFGNGYLDESQPGGAWVVTGPLGHVACICKNREVAEAALYDKAASSGYAPDRFTISVWTILETWPDNEEV